jgi:hypothetical protein
MGKCPEDLQGGIITLTFILYNIHYAVFPLISGGVPLLRLPAS